MLSPSEVVGSGFITSDYIFSSHLSHESYMPAHITLLDLVTVMIRGGEYKLWSLSLFSFLHRPVTSK
jgi:hypothetical protein